MIKNPNNSKNIIHFVHNLVLHYAKIDNDSDLYLLCVNDLPDFELHELCALIMNSDPILATEATGPDNPNYENKMFPAMIKYMKSSTDKDELYQFKNVWLDGIVSYFLEPIQEMLDQQCINYSLNARNELDYVEPFDLVRQIEKTHWNLHL
jgi:hypothetical protein